MSDTARPRPSARRRAPLPAPVAREAAGSPARAAVADAGMRPDGAEEEVPGAPDPTPDDGARGLRADDPADRPAGEGTTDDGEGDRATTPRRRRRAIGLPLVPALGVLLLLLLGLNAYLLAPRLFAEESSVRTGTYVDVLQAARANVVDLTSFDYLTIDEDIEQARRVTTGELTGETVGSLEDARQALVDGQAVTSTDVVGAGVTRATEDEGTVVMVISTTRQGSGVPAQVSRSRIEVDLQREGDRWLLSAIRGTGPDE
ncbi:hypothetical protein [Trujillonella endophytica]|uniref:Mce-associated membrane protein n=1 Tax=Trujillonella endophytica TaxID=673521 RepID=A0A1H8RL70_9ACTN|nr:hypothetical protein [Trujillella endophytica]SEO67135.1 Mce-associated membrane protein [Trujillella endophytica]